MKINFEFNIDIHRCVEACGYKIKGDKIVKEYNLSDFEEFMKEYVETELESGRNSNSIEENFVVNDAREFIKDFEYEYEER